MRRLGLAGGIEPRGLPIDGMIVTGEGGVSVEGRYPGGQRGLAISRREFDAVLLEQAIAAGAAFDGFAVREAIVDGPDTAPIVRGVIGTAGRHQLHAKVVIAADGRRSTVAFGLRLARHPPRPKRWAIGAYFEDPIRSTFGEMHIRRGRYIGVAPIGGGVSNVCLVLPWSGGDLSRAQSMDCDFRDPPGLLRNAIAAEPDLRHRFDGRSPIRHPIMLGPLAVDVAQGRHRRAAARRRRRRVHRSDDRRRIAIRGPRRGARRGCRARGPDAWMDRRACAARGREAPRVCAEVALQQGAAFAGGVAAGVHAAAAGARIAPGIVRRLIVRAGDAEAVA